MIRLKGVLLQTGFRFGMGGCAVESWRTKKGERRTRHLYDF
jgi:hypothetical protein